MNWLKNSCSVFSRTRLIRRKPAICTPPRPRCYNTFLRPPPPARRYYQHTAPRRQMVSRSGGGSRWYHEGRKVTAVALASGSTAIVVYFGNFEAAPFTDRTQFVVLTTKFERKLGESMFAKRKKELELEILPADDPQTVRVRRITSELVQAIHRGLAANDGEDAACGHGDIAVDLTIKNRDEDERQNRVTALQPRSSSLLDGWEVIVVKQDNKINATCVPGGKIIVYTGLLDKLKEDAEVGTVLGHEVGHAIARHSAETITMYLWLVIVWIVLLQVIDISGQGLSNMLDLLLSGPFSRWMEMEADHIGLMLLAAAGYDPRIAPGVYEKLGKVAGDSELSNIPNHHPSSEIRLQHLSQEQVMNKALELYREFSARQGTEERSPMDSGI